ncbi:MAG: NADPH:quinone oxidoreductase family protein [Streptomycetales bacterium]
MQAWRVHDLGEPEDVLSLDEVPAPEPQGGEVLVRVHAAALNFPDVLVCRGQYQERPTLPFTPGLEAAGEVVAVGAGVADVKPGERVIALPGLPAGGLAEMVCVPRQAICRAPEGMPAEQAAAFYVTYQTGHVGLHRRAGLKTGETLLVHAGAGGVGSAAVQLGKAAGARVVATAGGPEKTETCRRLGADLAVDYRTEDFAAAVKDFTGGRGADVVYDPVGGDVFDRSTRCVAFEGRIVVVGFTGGRFAQAATNHMLIKNYAVLGLHWGLYRARAPEVIPETYEALCALYAQGLVDPYVSQNLPFEQAPAGVAALGSRRSQGKIVVAGPA